MQAVTNISFTLNESILFTLRESKQEFLKQMLFNNALVLYRKNKLSLGKAAELAGYDRLSFMQKLNEEGEPVFDYSEEMVDSLIGGADKVKAMLSESK